MKDKILKQASCHAFEKEINAIPSEKQLQGVYSFSASFENRMEQVFLYVKNNYFEFGGKVISKKYFAAVLPLILIVLISYVRTFRDTSYRGIALLALIALRYFKNEYISQSRYTVESDFARDFEKRYTPAFIYNEPLDSNQGELDYILPQLPAGFTLKEESRTASRHNATFECDDITIRYEKAVKKGAILPKIPKETVEPVDTPLDYSKGFVYTDGGLNHLLFEDKFFIYHYQSNTDIQLIKDIAFGKNP